MSSLLRSSQTQGEKKMKVDTGIASKPSGVRILKMGDLVTINRHNPDDLCVVVGFENLDVDVISLKASSPYSVSYLDLNLFEGTAKISNDL
jgi:hypothetical protein